MTEMWPGLPLAFPLGALPMDGGTQFSVTSEVADAVRLCLFDDAGTETQLPMPVNDGGIWRGFVPGVGVGQRYGYRVSGPYDPAKGHRCNPAKLLLDPYARAVDGAVTWGDALSGSNDQDSAPFVPKSVVVDTTFAWGDDAPPRTPLADSVIYEAHVKGLTAAHPDVPATARGTYAGLAHPSVLRHLTSLGITAIELLPVHQSLSNDRLTAEGLENYWGYDTLGYFAPHADYSAAVRAGQVGGQLAEFQSMVKAVHAVGIEVILDVVYNHTVEGGPDGPTLCLRGLDNSAYYRLVPGNLAAYYDTTGCGNSLDTSEQDCLRLVTDSLRYWVTVGHVDGFRFDLAPTLARQDGSFTVMSAFLDVIHQDPILSQVKLIAEPWDVSQPDSYDVGKFPPGWSEWNGKFRDTARGFWRGDDGNLPDLATRLAGSADLYGAGRRRPTASINLLTTHDGFTLRDLVSYDSKHNHANGEHNRDGTDGNLSWNCGAEGDTDDPAILSLRASQSRALLATLLLSRGVPMLLGGDELGRTQAGNNNAYCQDNATSWYDWSAIDTDLLAFTTELIAFRKAHPVLRSPSFADATDLKWFNPAGRPMASSDWSASWAKTLLAYFDGYDSPDLDSEGRPETDDDLLVAINSYWEPVEATLPTLDHATSWDVEIDTVTPASTGTKITGSTVTLKPRSVLVLRSAR